MNNRKIKSEDLKNKRIAIGQLNFSGIKAFHMLKKDGIKVSMFFDKDFSLQHKKYNGTPIFPWSNFYDAYVILTNPSRYEELHKLLTESCGYDDDHIIYLEDIEFNCTINDINDDYDWEWIRNNGCNASNWYISNREAMFKFNFSDEKSFSCLLGVDITNKCTLNCEYCYTQMPYYRSDEKRNYDIYQIISNLDRFFEKVDYIPYLWILGGEPLIHPELDVLIRYINSDKVQKKVVHADILTNGTLLFSAKSLEALKENPLFWRISISPYGEHSKKQYDLFSQLSEANIPYYSRYMVYWQNFAQVITPKTFDENEIRKKCQNCVCGAMHITDEYIFRCAPLEHFVTLKRIPYDERNVFDCTKDYSKEELMAYHNGVCPGMAYCNGNHECYVAESDKDAFGGDYVPVAGQAKGVISCKRYE